MPNRKSDASRKLHFRTVTRLVNRNGEWFFQTREGERGPFANRESAQLQLDRYVDTMEYLEDKKDSLPPGVDWREVTLVDIDQKPEQ